MTITTFLLTAAPSLPHDDEHREAAELLFAFGAVEGPVAWAYVYCCAMNDNGPGLAPAPRAEVSHAS